MSFGWSAGDIINAISIIVKISKGLRESDGAASSYQDYADFLSSLAVTLEGINTIISKNAHLTWEQALIAQAQRLKDATETCVRKASKFEASLGTTSMKHKLSKAPRKVQWTLFRDSIEELKIGVGRTMGVMNDLILLQSLDSILELSKTSLLSFDELRTASEGLAQLLPSVKESVTSLTEEIKIDSETSNEKLTALEMRFSTGIQDLRADMAQLEVLKEAIDLQEQRREIDRELWQHELESTAYSLQSATKLHLELQLHDLKADIREMIDDEMSKRLPEPSRDPPLYASALQLMGTGVAATLGAFIALTVQSRITATVPQPRPSADVKLTLDGLKIERNPFHERQAPLARSAVTGESLIQEYLARDLDYATQSSSNTDAVARQIKQNVEKSFALMATPVDTQLKATKKEVRFVPASQSSIIPGSVGKHVGEVDQDELSQISPLLDNQSALRITRMG